jgi:hypothetical protein
VRRAVQYSFPTADIERMMAEIEALRRDAEMDVDPGSARPAEDVLREARSGFR